MYQMVHDIVNEYQPVWGNTPKFVSTFGTFSSKFEALKIHAEKERSYVVGVRQTRDENRKNTAALAIRVSSALTALGGDLKDLELIARMRITENQLNNRTHADTVILLDRIILYAQEHASALVDYGISEQILSDLIVRRDDLVVGIFSPRKAILKRKDSIAMMSKLSREMDEILKNSLDKLVIVLREESEEFHSAYFNSRMVLSYGPSGGNSGTEPNQY